MSEMPSSGTQKVPGQGYIRSSCLINSREIKEVGRRSKEKKSAIKTFFKKKMERKLTLKIFIIIQK